MTLTAARTAEYLKALSLLTFAPACVFDPKTFLTPYPNVVGSLLVTVRFSVKSLSLK